MNLTKRHKICQADLFVQFVSLLLYAVIEDNCFVDKEVRETLDPYRFVVKNKFVMP